MWNFDAHDVVGVLCAVLLVVVLAMEFMGVFK